MHTDDFRLRLYIDDDSAINNALMVAAERFTENAAEWRQLAASLRAGANVAFFAPGEAGARAADHTAQQFTRQAENAARLRSRIAGYDEDGDA